MARKRVLIRPRGSAMGRLLPMTTIPDPSIVNPGTVGAVVVFSLFVAVALVIRSGYKRLRNLDRRRQDEN